MSENQKKGHEPCKRKNCIFRAKKGDGWNCDYMWLTGKSRIAQAKTPEERLPENCSFFVDKKTDKGQKVLKYYKLLLKQGSRVNPCYNCPEKTPGCYCKRKQKYDLVVETKRQEKLKQLVVDDYAADNYSNHKAR